ncbi:NDP-hexose 2,3-dehydratase family protein [Spongiactinospora sp. TRM90649]|uniref:NDP-hexose 2,3-dehydratase family protein n=1 Tax=Spongiactinospora sp. TRM90649 TaxID=3031114 RepID=UPI0023F79237|nr:NDP-hexose 2,3-dehydratase family protein [Spongiactinospora sp. TRM90649]MDF5758941.1 NDP-hexose 2,3-dehydratase family protein [Spongiactinospora sp. TRM90649]
MRIAESALSNGCQFTRLADFHHWLADVAERTRMDVEQVPLEAMAGWARDPATGNIGHHSGRFFTVEGIDIRYPAHPVTQWTQPIINQGEVGILGILVKEFDGVPHCLMQAKNEPGNVNGLQLSPTVQATRSNYTRVHQGRPVPYLDYFRDAFEDPSTRVLADVRQSEQGAWFYRKRNRNMVVEVFGDVELIDGYCWLTLGQLHELLTVPDLVNMDARTVLSCLPFSGPEVTGTLNAGMGGAFREALVRSCDPDEQGVHDSMEILSWITEIRTRTDVFTEQIPLGALRRWHWADGRISHDTGGFFDVVGVSVEAAGREVGSWAQPMIRPVGMGVIAFLVKRIGGVLHVLTHTRAEPGYADVVELAPTVQCTPETYDLLPPEARPRYLDEVLNADPSRIRFESVLSEEGGRFFHARNRYMVVETDLEAEDPEFRWLTVHQLEDLLRHSYYVNVQARSLSACLLSLVGTAGVTATAGTELLATR